TTTPIVTAPPIFLQLPQAYPASGCRSRSLIRQQSLYCPLIKQNIWTSLVISMLWEKLILLEPDYLPMTWGRAGWGLLLLEVLTETILSMILVPYPHR